MIEFKRQKTLSKEFGRIVVNENDIFRIARIMQKLPERFGGELKIAMITGDEEETLRTSNIEIFNSDDLPTCLSTVSINYLNYEAPVSCSVTLSSKINKSAKIEVDGTDTDTVTALFHELEREIKTKISALSKLYLFSEKGFLPFFAIHFFTGIACAAAIYSIFDIPLDLINQSNAQFKDTFNYKLIAGFGGICIGFAFFGGIFIFEAVVKKSFPPVEFSGRLADPSKPSRKRLVFIMLFIIIPILVNVSSGLITDILQKIS
jgi:hypothetical protein